MGLAAALFVMGLAAGVHCVGMCGGIVLTFSQQPLQKKSDRLKRQIAFNAGRIATYGAAGAVAGLVGGAGVYMAGALPVQQALQVLVSLLVLGVGLHLLGVTNAVLRIEALGAPLWNALQPVLRKISSGRTIRASFFAGTLWGWLPCGLVYTALASAALSASPLDGAMAMAGFGLGTLPWLLAAGALAARLRAERARRALRFAAAALLLGFGFYGLARAEGVAGAVRNSILCIQGVFT